LGNIPKQACSLFVMLYARLIEHGVASYLWTIARESGASAMMQNSCYGIAI
jgi:hypothetical protein